MTHEELLDKIEDIEYWQEKYAGKTFINALRAVVKLHYEHIGGAEQAVYCYECTRHYPCPTIQAIEKELQVSSQ